MFVYAFLILLPAAVLADKCDKNVLDELFRVLDGNKDKKVSTAEAYALIKKLDLDGDGAVVLLEAALKAPEIAPSLVGHEADIIAVLDFSRDGRVDEWEIKMEFKFIDTNRDGSNDEKEWERFVKVLCPMFFPTFPKV